MRRNDVFPFEQLGRETRRKRLLKEANFACTQCGYNKTRENGKSILEIDHIDGNHLNNTRENLRVLCPNCHALTPNFGSWGRSPKVRTSSRTERRKIEYKEAKKKALEKEKEYEVQFCKRVLQMHVDATIDFGKFGWVQRLAELTNEIPQVVRRKVKRWMPEFYWEHCFRKNAPKRMVSVA